VKIICSKNAKITFDSIVNYLEHNFGLVTTKKFIANTDSHIKSITKFPEIHKAVSLNIPLEGQSSTSNVLLITRYITT